ncbi:MAG: hypothetical protein ACQCXQ_03490 [Verrucomicrobiales bacterium]|nr:hypothetical protein [Verrucomicrobiota bacterium JB025]
MKSVVKTMTCVVLLAAGLTWWLGRQGHEWAGVDETVVEKYADAAGRPARDPYINTDQGDLLLFCFLVAGVAGGFVGGYCFRDLFPAKTMKDKP